MGNKISKGIVDMIDILKYYLYDPLRFLYKNCILFLSLRYLYFCDNDKL